MNLNGRKSTPCFVLEVGRAGVPENSRGGRCGPSRHRTDSPPLPAVARPPDAGVQWPFLAVCDGRPGPARCHARIHQRIPRSRIRLYWAPVPFSISHARTPSCSCSIPIPNADPVVAGPARRAPTASTSFDGVAGSTICIAAPGRRWDRARRSRRLHQPEPDEPIPRRRCRHRCAGCGAVEDPNHRLWVVSSDGAGCAALLASPAPCPPAALYAPTYSPVRCTWPGPSSSAGSPMQVFQRDSLKLRPHDSLLDWDRGIRQASTGVRGCTRSSTRIAYVEFTHALHLAAADIMADG